MRKLKKEDLHLNDFVVKISLTILFLSFISPMYSQVWVQVSDFPNSQSAFGFSYEHNGKGYWLAPTSITDAIPDDLLYEYDSVEDTWSVIPNDGYPRIQLEMADYYNNKVYLGYGRIEGTSWEFENKIWEFDPSNGEYTELAVSPAAPRSFGALLVHNDVIYSGSGFVEDLGDDKEWWAFDMNTNTWTQKADLPDDHLHRSINFVVGDYIYVCGSHENFSWYKYDIINDRWSRINTELGGRHVTAVKKYNGKVYIYGGEKDNHDPLPIDENFMEYDPVMDTWTKLPPIPNETGRVTPGMFIIGDRLYVAGGGELEDANTTWFFDLRQITTSVVDRNLDVKKLEVFPNPTSDILNLTNIALTDGQFVIIHDSAGKQLYSGELKSTQINVNSFPKGEYVLSVVSESEVRVSKFLRI